MKTKSPFLLLILMAFIVCVSCNKEHMKEKNMNPENVFHATRSGQIVTLRFNVDFPEHNIVHVLRNKTGIPSRRPVVASLTKGPILQYEDILPDADAYYYWIRLLPKKEEDITYGPIRVAPDGEGVGTYRDNALDFPVTVSRTHDRATISWNFPEKKYEFIYIKRKTHIREGKNITVYKTKEWKGQLEDTFPDPEADYWYWVVIKQENGMMINRGPIKADYIADN